MSLYEYNVARRNKRTGDSIMSSIMTAMLTAMEKEPSMVTLLAITFPDIWTELSARLTATHGKLDGDQEGL